MVIRFALATLAATLLSLPSLGADAPNTTITVAAVTPSLENTPAYRDKMSQVGQQYKSAWDFFDALRQRARGGTPLKPAALPDWEGLYSRTKGMLAFDPDGPPQGAAMPLAKFTPVYKAKLVKRFNDLQHGIEWDPLSHCESPTYPRWLDLPFMREFIVTPHQTTMISEAFNSVRRVYTDGRGHVPVEDQYPTEMGDSIGFWVNGDTLVVHVNQSMAHMYERAQGEYSDQVEGIEVWHKVDGNTLVANVWIYDPPSLLQPWYTRQSYSTLPNPDKSLRLNNWSCKGNPNNDVIETKDGGSQFKEFTFDKSTSDKSTSPPSQIQKK